MMDNLVQKLNWDVQKLNGDVPFIKNQCMFVYAEADLVSNRKMQEPLQKLYQYENQPDIREKIREYISELDVEIDRLERDLEKQMIFNMETTKVAITESRMKALIDVKTDLEGRLMEDV